jgi:GNAT superfamily N-acetyltransferase
VILRPARPDDYEAFTRFWAQLITDQAPPTQERWIETLCPNTSFLVADDGSLAAYNLSFAFGARGDVRQVVVDQAWRNRGLGRVLMGLVADRLRGLGCTEWHLEVKADNAPAIRLYESVGMRALFPIEQLGLPVEVAERFAATRTGSMEVALVTPFDDAALETALDFGRGQIQRWRTARLGMPLIRIGTTALTQVWHDFSPTRALLFPFHARDPNTAAHLVAAAVTHMPVPKPLEICVITPSVHTAMLAAGARQMERQIEYGGPL